MKVVMLIHHFFYIYLKFPEIVDIRSVQTFYVHSLPY